MSLSTYRDRQAKALTMFDPDDRYHIENRLGRALARRISRR
jgi:hypothetical protein